MVKDWVRFESIELDKNKYYLTYEPIFTGQSLAVLVISVYEEMDASEIISILEAEFEYWIEKYPTPLMVMVSNKTKAQINLEKYTGNDYIVGYPVKNDNPVMKWEVIPDEEYSHVDVSKDALSNIYRGLNFKTSNDAEKEISKRVRDKKKLIFVMLLWFSIIPALIAYYGWSNPYVSVIAFIYSLYIAIRKGGEITGHFKVSEKEIKKADDNRVKEHHHYHCKLNPEGFLRLKHENFSKESEASLRSKIEELNS